MRVDADNVEHAIQASIICPEISEYPLFVQFVDRRYINEGIVLEVTRADLIKLWQWATRDS